MPSLNSRAFSHPPPPKKRRGGVGGGRQYIFLPNIQADQKCNSVCLSTWVDYLPKRCSGLLVFNTLSITGGNGGRGD